MRQMHQMTHFQLEQWVDFVRGLVPEPERDSMREHLDNGCAECTQAVALLRIVVTAAREDRSLIVPPEVVRLARAVYSPPEMAASSFKRIVGKLMFGGIANPELAGSRHSMPFDRQLAFEAGDYCVDLRVEEEQDSRRSSMVGQIVNRKLPASRLAELPVTLVVGKKVISETLSNEFGEFCMDYTARRNLRLQIKVPEDRAWVDLPLNRLIPGNDSSS